VHTRCTLFADRGLEVLVSESGADEGCEMSQHIVACFSLKKDDNVAKTTSVCDLGMKSDGVAQSILCVWIPSPGEGVRDRHALHEPLCIR